jgi:hypothetical protein
MMGEVHDLLAARGKQAAIDAGIDRNVVEAAFSYLSDEDSSLALTYSGWATCSLPHKRLPDDRVWSVVSERVSLAVEPGRRPTAPGSTEYQFVGVPYGSHARLILLYLQSEAIRTRSREIELGSSMREWLSRIGVPPARLFNAPGRPELSP